MPLSARVKRQIEKAFVEPGHPVAFSTPNRVAKHFGVKVKDARAVLEGIEGYTMHREFKQPKPYNPYYVRTRRKQVQADLIDVSALSRENNGRYGRACDQLQT